MAERRPLVEITGEVQELPLGDNLPSSADILTRTTVSAFAAGQVGYVAGAGTVELARADAAGTSDAFAFALAAIGAASAGQFIANGVITLTTGEWDVVTGQVGGLTASAKYWLDPTTVGNMTTTAPSTSGQYVVELGEALSPTEMHVRIRRRILKA